MMYELKQVECPNAQNSIKLHPDVIEILFENRRYIKNVFADLKSLYGISHMSIAFIDPSHELIAFSTTPNIEYNLIHQNLWEEDPCFIPDISHKNSLLWWDYEQEKIEKIKLLNNRFTLGMTISRPIDDFHLIYAFATQEKQQGLRQYYQENLFSLIDIGDYFYKSIRGLYASCNHKHTPPLLNQFGTKASCGNIRPFLRIV